jgi:hypothetical protein
VNILTLIASYDQMMASFDDLRERLDFLFSVMQPHIARRLEEARESGNLVTTALLIDELEAFKDVQLELAGLIDLLNATPIADRGLTSASPELIAALALIDDLIGRLLTFVPSRD